jgi:hypothetical protein
MKRALVGVAIACMLASSSAMAIEKKAYQMREEFGTAPLHDCILQYYYYIPCPTYSWFWAFSGWHYGDVVGKWFEIGDLSTGGFGLCDPVDCQLLESIRVMDLNPYGTIYPGMFTVEFDIFCADQYGCPVGPSLWHSHPIDTGWDWGYGFNYVLPDPPVSICPCAVDPGPPSSTPRILVTATHTGTLSSAYPAWGTDNISAPLDQGCVMHDSGCLPALYPRPYVSHYPTMHSGYYGFEFEFCPPLWFKDGADTTADGSQYGFVELAWSIYIACTGPTGTETTTWGSIKSLYR